MRGRKCGAYRTISYKIWGQITISNNVDVKRSSSCCFRAHNLHVGVTVLRALSTISFFPSHNLFFSKFRRILNMYNIFM